MYWVWKNVLENSAKIETHFSSFFWLLGFGTTLVQSQVKRAWAQKD